MSLQSKETFIMPLRSQMVTVAAALDMNEGHIQVTVALSDAQGRSLDWQLTRRELAAVCRMAAEVSDG